MGELALHGPLRILPAGPFRADDGRPRNLASWYLDADAAAAIIVATAARREDVVIDYEHASLSVGVEAPAAGWLRRLEWRPDDGLYALEPLWTPRGRERIEAGEYRYISPAFYFDPNTGVVTGLHSVALTNKPALTGLADLNPRMAAARFAASLEPLETALEGDFSGRARDMFVRTFGFVP